MGVRGRSSYSAGVGFGALSFAVIAVLSVVSSIAIARVYGISVVGAFALVTAPVNAVWYLSSARERPAFVRELALLEPRAPRCTGLFVAMLAFSFGLTAVVSALAVPVVYLVFHGAIGHPALFMPVVVSLAAYTFITNTGWNLDAVFAAFRAGRELFWVRLHQAVVFLVVAVALSSAVGGVWALVAATACSSVTSLVHRVVLVRRFMPLTVSRDEARAGFQTLPEMISFGLKIVPGSIANGVSTESGTWVLGITSNIAALGAYNRAWTLASRLVEVNWRITEMLFPTLVARRSGRDRTGFDRALVDTLRYCAAGLLLPASAGGGAAASIMALYGPGFGRAAGALAVLLAVPAVITLASVQRHALMAVDRPWITSVTAISKMVLTVIASVALTHWLGMTGTALGLLTGAAAEMAWMAALTARYVEHPMRTLWPLRQRIAILLAYGAGFAAARGVVAVVPGIPGLVPALVVGAAAYVATLIAAGAVNERDRVRAATLAARLRRRSRVATMSS